MPSASYADVRRVARIAHEVLDELGASAGRRPPAARACTSTCGSRHWGWADVRRAAHAFAREVERRSAGLVRPDVVAQGPRPGLDLRGLEPEHPRPHDPLRVLGARAPEAPVSTPIRWDEID